MKKPFTAIMATHDAPEATELSVLTSCAVMQNYVERLIIYDSSSNARTPEILHRLEKEIDIIQISPIYGRHRLSHWFKIDTGILDSETEFSVILDSDIEFYDGSLFERAEKLFRSDNKLFLAGQLQHEHDLGKNYIRAKQFSAGAIFVRTEIAKQYIAKGISFRPTQKRETTGIGRTRILYDVGGYLYRTSLEEGYLNNELDISGLRHYGAMSVINTRNKNIPQNVIDLYYKNLEEINQNLAKRVWENLIQHPRS